MAIDVKCGHCGKVMRVKDSMSGTVGLCPHCKSQIQVPHLVAKPVQSAPSFLPSEVVIQHKSGSKGGAFKWGFGLMLGVLAAVFAVTIGGCMVVAMLFTGMAVAVNEAANQDKVRTYPAPVASKTEKAALPTKSDVRILRAEYSRESGNPVITITARNDSSKTVKKVYLHTVMTSPFRSSPWAEGEIPYAPPGGLGAGTTQTWTLAPGQGTAFASAHPPDNTKLEATVTDVQFAD